MMHYSLKTFENLKKSIQRREGLLPFDFLGRTLAYNPYVPRALVSDLARDGKIAKKCFNYPAFSYERLSFVIDLDSEFIMVDFRTTYEENILGAGDFDCLTQLRRYSQKFIIHNDIFLNEYQILESCIYGSDCIVLDAEILGKDLASMCEFAIRLALIPIVKITSLKNLKSAIFAKAQVFYITQDFSNLIASVPNSKIILCDLPSDVSELDEKSSYGVDMFFVQALD
ncbi:hypothetical protein [Helicobacter sp. 13S00482-2]|uniref:hypothetical protein n=1 Tax=Helicobacter sp. 13S00482-2 TaxID=1476200 RepID=UPI0021517A28|nr:hypothetical protein [Helicobacter sp. 13S00482-2]